VHPTYAALEHVIRAAAAIATDPDIVVIGSQAILGQFPDAPAELRVSNEADVYPKGHPERSDLIDGSIGELSPFHETYASTPVPVEQRERLHRLIEEDCRQLGPG
jgi:hypothetical protein